MKRIITFALFSMLITWKSYASILTIEVQNLNSSGPGSLLEAILAVNAAKDISICSVWFNSSLKGEVTVQTALRPQNMNQFSLTGSPDVDVKFENVDTAIVMKDINLPTIRNFRSSSESIMSIDECDNTYLKDNLTQWITYAKNGDIFTVQGGQSFGFNTHKIAGVTINEHTVAYFGYYLLWSTDTEYNGNKNKKINLTNNTIGLHLPIDPLPGREGFVKYYGVKIVNSFDTDIDIRNNEIQWVSALAGRDTSGIGVHIRNTTGSIEVVGNYFGTNKELAVQARTETHGIFMENISDCSNISIDSNYFFSCMRSGIKVLNLNDTASISGNKFGYNPSGAVFEDAILLENSSHIFLLNNVMANCFKDLIVLKNSHNIYARNNFLGLSDSTGTSFKNAKSFYTGINIDSNSQNNVFRENYIMSMASGYGIKTHGLGNDIAVNYVACNDSGDFKFYQTNTAWQEAVLNASLTHSVSSSGLPISLTISNLIVPNGFKAHIYKSIPCGNYTIASMQESYVDSLTIDGQTSTYTFPTSSRLSNNRVTSKEDSAQYYILVLDENNDPVGTSGKSTKDVILSSNDMVFTDNFYPNPCADILYLGMRYDWVKVFDLMGKEVISAVNANAMDLRNLKVGIYVVKTERGNERIVIR